VGFADADLTRDVFLGGRVAVWQPVSGYRAATDPVLLAAAVDASAGETVLELGCGVGVATLCLAARIPGVVLTGVERQADYADLARRNAGAVMDVFTADLTALPAALRQQSFDHVIANPPYFPAGSGTPARDAGRETALREETPLARWTDTAARRLKPKGWLTMIHGVDRVPDLLAALAPDFGAIALRPLAPRKGRAAPRVLIRARKGARAPFSLLAPLVLHDGPAHVADGDDFTAFARAVLRDGAAIPWT
jgi:tRNA1(Val) A37 N6-methylase TrmN6